MAKGPSKEDIAKKSIIYMLLKVIPSDFDSSDTILTRAIDLAYSDATSHVLRSGALEREVASYALMGQIKELSEGKRYDDWHSDACEALKTTDKASAHPQEHVTYGIAQKWINMTMKYLYILSSLTVGTDFDRFYKTTLARYEEEFHIPIDSFVIDACWWQFRNNRKELFADSGHDASLIRGRTPDYEKDDYKRPSEYFIPWSQWNKEQYKTFQNALKGVLEDEGVRTPLMWEADAWIEASKKVNKPNANEWNDPDHRTAHLRQCYSWLTSLDSEKPPPR